MRRKAKKILPGEVEGVRGELAAWRGQRRPGQRIPEKLWAGAVRAARRHGLHRVGCALGLDYYQLKRRVGESENALGPKAEVSFVELARGERPGSQAVCVVELEKDNGAKLRVSVTDGSRVDWRQVKEAFLGA